MNQPVTAQGGIASLAKAFDTQEKSITASSQKLGVSRSAFLRALKAEQAQSGATAAATGKLSEVFRGLTTSTGTLEGPLNGVTGRLSSLSGLVGGLTTATGGFGLVLGAIVAVAAGAAAGIYELTTSVAESTGKFIDLSQQTGFSVETLSGLANAAETTGGSIDTISASLGLFETHMQEAKEKGSEMSKLFKALNIDSTNNEKALRQALVALQNLSTAEERAAAGKKLFGRSYRELLAAVTETGDFDAFLNQQLQKGTLITTEAAERGDKLSDSVIEMGRAFESARRIVADEFGPDVLRVVKALTKFLEDNRKEVKAWADEVKLAVYGLQPLVASIQTLDSALRNLIGIPVVDFLGGIIRYGSATGLIVTALQAIGRNTQPKPLPQDLSQFVQPLNAPPSQRFKSLGGFRTGLHLPVPTAKGGGGGGGDDPAKIAERIAKLQLDATVAGLRAEQDANKRSLDLRREDFNQYATEYMVIENRRHNAVIAGLDAEQRAAEKLKKGRSVALQEIANRRAAEDTQHDQNRNKVLDERARIVDQQNNFLRDQGREIASLTTSTTKWDDAYQQLVDTLKEEGVTLEANTRSRVEANIVRAKELELVLSVTRARRIAETTRDRIATKAMRERPPWMDLGGGSTVGGEPATTERSRIATAEEQVFRDQLEQRRAVMQSTAEDLGSIFGDVFMDIRDGWKKMWDDMLRTAMNIGAQITQELFTALFSKLFNVPYQNQSGGIAGLFVNGIFNRQQPAPAGGAGAVLGGALAGARATGGPTEPDAWYQVNERGQEFFKASVPGTIIPVGPESRRYSQQPSQRESQRQDIMRLAIVDDERQAREMNARTIVRLNRRMRKVGKLVPV